MIVINSTLALPETEVVVTFIRANGPGGQNVNKVSSAAQLRFDVRRSPSLPESVRKRLERAAGAKLTKEGEIVITANRFRTQEANRRDAINRLVELIGRASVPPKPRVRTQPSLGAKRRRQEAKGRRSSVKQLRRGPGDLELL